MNVCIVCGIEAAHHRDFAVKFAEGIKRCGHKVELATPDAVPDTADVIVTWGWRTAAPFVASGRNAIIAERGYIGDRYAWTSLAWNGLNGRGIFPPISGAGSGARGGGKERLAKFFPDLLKPWNPLGWYALIIGQVPGDAALYGSDLGDWYRKQAAAFLKQGIPSRFRPHPLAVELNKVYPVEGAPIINGTLSDAIGCARVVVTWNSTAGVDAVIAGKPTIACDRGSMAWEVSMHGATILELEPARDVWAEQLVCKQWNDEELRSGAAWLAMTDTL